MSTLLCCIAAIGLHLGSAHLGEQPHQNLNDANPGVYVELQNGITAGTYYNSVRRQSSYAGYTLQGPSIGPLEPALFIGGISGYSKGITPAIVPSVYLPLGDFGVRLVYIPRISATKVHTLHLAVEFHF